MLSSAVQARGPIVTLRTDRVQMPDHEVADRQVVEHPGAVVIVALDEAGQVLMIRQYRHPVAHVLWELPAGLRDVRGEPPRATAERELLEETGYRARDWRILVDFYSSPGISTEWIRVFLARDLVGGPGGAARLRAPARGDPAAGPLGRPGRGAGRRLSRVTCTMVLPRWVSCPRMPLGAAASPACGPRTRVTADRWRVREDC